MSRLTLPSSPSTFWRNKKWLSSPTHRTPLIWNPVTSSNPKNEIETERKPGWYHWGDPSRIAESAWHTDRKGLSGSVRKMDETVRTVSTCGREQLRGWWRPIGLMVSFMIFTAPVRNILDIPSYLPRQDKGTIPYYHYQQSKAVSPYDHWCEELSVLSSNIQNICGIHYTDWST
jgi:hypothetical protein